jgi:hypothetical protein
VNAPVWCVELAANFWAKAGPPPCFPRDLRDVISGVSLSVVAMKGVSVTRVRQWFEHIEIPLLLNEPDRELRACLVAWADVGFAFVDSRDEPAEQAFSLAHELGHFLRDYLQPRQRVVERIGASAVEVLDCRRPPTPDERLHAVLRNVPLGPLTHLLRRDESGRPLTPIEREAEDAADRLAFELLAPASEIGAVSDRETLIERLVRDFGLPLNPATRYAALVIPAAPRLDQAVARLLTR